MRPRRGCLWWLRLVIVRHVEQVYVMRSCMICHFYKVSPSAPPSRPDVVSAARSDPETRSDLGLDEKFADHDERGYQDWLHENER